MSLKVIEKKINTKIKATFFNLCLSIVFWSNYVWWSFLGTQKELLYDYFLNISNSFEIALLLLFIVPLLLTLFFIKIFVLKYYKRKKLFIFFSLILPLIFWVLFLLLLFEVNRTPFEGSIGF